MKKVICLLLTAAVLLSMGISAFAEEISEEPVTREPGYCGENIRWNYENGVLTFEGSGPMDDFYAGQPWQEHREDLRQVKLSGEITSLGAYAFPDYDALETVEFGNSLQEIGQGAFSGCDGLQEISLPMSFRVFGEESFSHCKNLKEIHFEGGFPKFKLNSMWDTYAKLYYPAERPWPLEHIQQLEEAFKGRIEFLASDGTDPYAPEEETQAPTEQETEPVTTEAAEVPTTLPATEPPTEPVTEAPAQAPAETTAPVTEETRVPETEYVELPEPEETPMGMGLSLPAAGLIFLMVVSGGGALFMLGRMSHNQKKDFAGNFSEILLEDEKKTRNRPTTAQKKARSHSRKKGGKYSK